MIREDHLNKTFREFFSKSSQAGFKTSTFRYTSMDIPMVKAIIDNKEIYVMEEEHGTAA